MKEKYLKEQQTRIQIEEQLQNSVMDFQELYKDAEEAKLVVLQQLTEIKLKKQELQTKEQELKRQQGNLKKKYGQIENFENMDLFAGEDDLSDYYLPSNPSTDRPMKQVGF